MKMKSRALSVQPIPILDELPAYTVGRPEGDIDLFLDFNESLKAPAALDDDLNRYPELPCSLEADLSARFGVPADSIVITCGADDALERAVRCVCSPGRTAILATPTYGMVRRFVKLTGADLKEVSWWDGDFPVEAVCREAGEKTALVAVVSPSNPTGATASRKALRELLDRLPQTLVIVDQAYVEFTDPENDLLPVVLEYPNAVLIRTFSKAWACAGLRIGYAIGDPRVIGWMRRVGLPFPASRPSCKTLRMVLESGPDQTRILRIREERQRLISVLEQLGAETWPSEGSFVLARFEESNKVWRGLAALGIAVRFFAGRNDLQNCLRFTLPGDSSAFERLQRGLRSVLAPEALLFDLDGVLADVSGSYRTAIINTASSFGVDLTVADITKAKATGNANNDWKLTQTLLKSRGVDADIDEVTRRFEVLYQGNDGRPGLRSTESLLLDANRLQDLSARLPLAVVTGRPRADAERFLTEQRIDRFFTTVVAMEDAPAKPNPAPVCLALERLGVNCAWMIGDTPDDMVSARAAGVLAIGVPAPGDDPTSARKALTKNGAWTVLDSIDLLIEMTMEILP